MARDPKGRFASSIKTWHDRHPTGRKHCTGCKRWRHVRDFCVAQWCDVERTMPLKFQSKCEYCEAERQRVRRGHRPKNWYPCGKPGTERYDANRTRYRRRLYHLHREPPVLDGIKVYEFLSRFLVLDVNFNSRGGGSNYWRLNGKPLAEKDSKCLAQLRNGDHVSFWRIDNLLTEHEISMWELEEFAKIPRKVLVL